MVIDGDQTSTILRLLARSPCCLHVRCLRSSTWQLLPIALPCPALDTYRHPMLIAPQCMRAMSTRHTCSRYRCEADRSRVAIRAAYTRGHRWSPVRNGVARSALRRHVPTRVTQQPDRGTRPQRLRDGGYHPFRDFFQSSTLVAVSRL